MLYLNMKFSLRLCSVQRKWQWNYFLNEQFLQQNWIWISVTKKMRSELTKNFYLKKLNLNSDCIFNTQPLKCTSTIFTSMLVSHIFPLGIFKWKKFSILFSAYQIKKTIPGLFYTLKSCLTVIFNSQITLTLNKNSE